MASKIKKELEKAGDKERARNSRWFFKTGKGEYGEGDIFWGIKVPEQRQIAKKFSHISLKEIEELLHDKVHECRLTALLVLVEKYAKAGEKEKEIIFKFYLKNYKYINNWDLVDLSAPKIVGDFLLSKNRKILYELAKSDNVWKKRIAVLVTFAFIKNKDLTDALKIAEILLNDEHDLIRKAVGWMLRETGKRDKKAEIDFLEKYASQMPRVMLRYAIEKLSPAERSYFLSKH
ncbi:MAG: DNA alkylation repair protein [Candidatus Pacebacteria bacterium]|nr:DNA alkylation repair protein [Candidatus Paceibacterota bacterium]